jgi:hypothetical protein
MQKYPSLSHHIDADHVGLHQEHNQRLTELEQLKPVVDFSSRELVVLQNRLVALERLQALEGWWLTRFVFWTRKTWSWLVGLFNA